MLNGLQADAMSPKFLLLYSLLTWSFLLINVKQIFKNILLKHQQSLVCMRGPCDSVQLYMHVNMISQLIVFQ